MWPHMLGPSKVSTVYRIVELHSGVLDVYCRHLPWHFFHPHPIRTFHLGLLLSPSYPLPE